MGEGLYTLRATPLGNPSVGVFSEVSVVGNLVPTVALALMPFTLVFQYRVEA
jgi:hypothetical protein